MTRKLYTGPIVDLTFDGEMCQHAGECVRGMPSVFNVHLRPWANPNHADTPELAGLLREVIGRCPSGALEVAEHEVAG
jgi:uncharacterized Fe-S cluster protein YjdI